MDSHFKSNTKVGGFSEKCLKRSSIAETLSRGTGIGMDEVGIAKALSLYDQVENADVRRQEGTGLGLPLACRLTGAHGGTLLIASEKGVGTTVTVILPAGRVKAV